MYLCSRPPVTIHGCDRATAAEGAKAEAIEAAAAAEAAKADAIEAAAAAEAAAKEERAQRLATETAVASEREGRGADRAMAAAASVNVGKEAAALHERARLAEAGQRTAEEAMDRALLASASKQAELEASRSENAVLKIQCTANLDEIYALRRDVLAKQQEVAAANSGIEAMRKECRRAAHAKLLTEDAADGAARQTSEFLKALARNATATEAAAAETRAAITARNATAASIKRPF